MTNVAASEIYRWVVACLQTDQVGENVLFLQCLSITGTGPTETKMALDLDLAMSVVYVPILSGDASYYGSSFQKIWPLPKRNPVIAVANFQTGGMGSKCMGRQLAGLIQKRTNNTGPGGRGRIYLSFPDTTATDTGGVPSGAYVTAAGTLASFLTSTHTVGTAPNQAVMRPVLWNYPLSVSTPIQSANVIDRWATQRRRGSYGRPNNAPF